ncbi:MAG: 2-hydroxyacyl-CoA dehydratase, partial [Clostridia bacterium]|nr:2-hydroxyacyl-CoA dehydratase [Clostridia bacterium]
HHEDIMSSLSQLKADVLASYQPEKLAAEGKKKRILVTGCPIGGVLDKTVKLLEKSGAVVVCHENCSGYKAAYQMVDAEAPDIYRAIAERYLEIGCSVMSPNPVRMELLPRLVDAFKVDGVVEVVLQACTAYSVEAHNLRNAVQAMGLPYLGIETDYSTADQGQLRTRIEAFVELMD